MLFLPFSFIGKVHIWRNEKNINRLFAWYRFALQPSRSEKIFNTIKISLRAHVGKGRVDVLFETTPINCIVLSYLVQLLYFKRVKLLFILQNESTFEPSTEMIFDNYVVVISTQQHVHLMSYNLLVWRKPSCQYTGIHNIKFCVQEK